MTPPSELVEFVTRAWPLIAHEAGNPDLPRPSLISTEVGVWSVVSEGKTLATFDLRPDA